MKINNSPIAPNYNKNNILSHKNQTLPIEKVSFMGLAALANYNKNTLLENKNSNHDTADAKNVKFIKEKIAKLPKESREFYENFSITKENVLIFNKILNSEKLYANRAFDRSAKNLLNIKNPLNEYSYKLIDELINDKNLYNNEILLEYCGGIIAGIDKELDYTLAKKILTSKNLNNNERFLRGIKIETDDKEETNAKIELINTISNNEKIYNNKWYLEYAKNVLQQEKLFEKINLVNKILNNEKLYKDRKIFEQAALILDNVNTLQKTEVTSEILEDEKLSCNETYLFYAKNIIKLMRPDEKTKPKCALIRKMKSLPEIPANENTLKQCLEIIANAKNEGEYKYVDKILDNPLLYTNELFMENAGSIVYYSLNNDDKQNEIDLKIAFLDKILSNEKLYNNKNLVNSLPSIFMYIQNEKELEAKFIMLDKFVNDERLYNDENFKYLFAGQLRRINDIESANAKCKVIDEILNSKHIYANKKFMENAWDIAVNTEKNNEAYIKCNFLKKIENSEALYSNKIFMKYAPKHLNKILSKEQTTLINKIFNDERLFGCKEFMKNPEITWCLDFETANAKNRLIEKILSNETIYNNKKLMGIMSSILCNINNQQQTEMLDKILDNSCFYTNESFMENAVRLLNNCNDSQSAADAKCAVFNKILNDENLKNDRNFIGSLANLIQKYKTPEEANDFNEKIYELMSKGLTPVQATAILSNFNNISMAELLELNKIIGINTIKKFSMDDIRLAIKFIQLHKKENINELSEKNKKNFLRELISSNSCLFNTCEEFKNEFPLIPSNQDEYCTFIPSLVKSLGVETKHLNIDEIQDFNLNTKKLSEVLTNMTDEEFNQLSIKQEYSKDDFIKDVLNNVSKLSKKEKQKVYDYFGFELHTNNTNKTGYSITGYPTNLSDDKKLDEIIDPKTKKVIENLRQNVVRFIEYNKIICNNKELENYLNKIITYLPELRPQIGKIQAGMNGLSGSHDFDIMKHSLKVLKEILKNPEFKNLNDSDKKIMTLGALLHDIAKPEGLSDRNHAKEGSFDIFFITQKFNLTREQEIKLYTLVKHHEWLSIANTRQNEEDLKKTLQSLAYDLRHDNMLDMEVIFTHADLMAVRGDGSFHNTKKGISRRDFNGNIRSFGEATDYYAGIMKKYIDYLKPEQPLLPITNFPKASRINKAIKNINNDGSTNIKGIYKDKDGLIIIKFNEVENWEEIGFPKGSISRGIKFLSENKTKIDTGNIKFFAHGLQTSNELTKFDAFSLVDSDALLSVSYAERPETKYRFFRPQGVILNTDTKYIHGGGCEDAGSGYKKTIDKFKKNHVFGNGNDLERNYISQLIKEATLMDDKEYVEFVKNNENKSFNEIEPEKLRNKILTAICSINSSQKRGEREYNEMYITNPKPPMAVFAYSLDKNEKIDNPIDFLNRENITKGEKVDYKGIEDLKSVKERTNFLKKYALERDIPFIIFGD